MIPDADRLLKDLKDLNEADGPAFDEWMKLDLSYIDNWSLQTDFMLPFKTAGTVLTGAGR